MRRLHVLSIILGLLLLSETPAAANSRRDYIEDRLDYWVDYAADFGYEIVETEVSSIWSNDSLSFYLQPGDYYAYAEGGRNIEDLDMVVYGDRGRELGSDNLADNFPIVEFTLREDQDVEFELSVYELSGYDDDYYCFVLARGRSSYGGHRGYDDDWCGNNWNNGRGDWYRGRNYDNWDNNWNYWQDWTDDWDNWSNDSNGWNGYRNHPGGRHHDNNYWNHSYWNNWGDNFYGWHDWDSSRNDRNYDNDYGRDNYGNYYNYRYSDRRRDVENKLEDIYDFAWSRRLIPIMEDVREISETRTYRLTLERGYYVAFAAGGDGIDDLDLHVKYDGWTFAEDIETDANPAVWFNVPSRTSIEIEVEVFSFNGWTDQDYICLLVCSG